MTTVADIILILSVISLIVGLIKPSIFHKLTNGTHQRKKISLTFGLGILVAMIMLLIFAPTTLPKKTDAKASANTTASQQSTVDTTSAAYKLAQYDMSGSISASTVTTYQKALDTLKPLCTVQDEMKLASQIYGTWQDLQDNGIKDETTLSVANHIIASIPASTAPVDCQGVMAAYLVEREPAH